MKITAIKTWLCDAYRANLAFVKIETDDGAVVKLDGRLAEAMDAGIGFDFHERQVHAVGVTEPGLDSGDFHRSDWDRVMESQTVRR